MPIMGNTVASSVATWYLESKITSSYVEGKGCRIRALCGTKEKQAVRSSVGRQEDSAEDI